MSGSLEVRPDLVQAGVRDWESAHARLDAATRAARDGILGVDAAAVFGADTAGRAFTEQYTANGGPAKLLFGSEPTDGGAVVAALGTGGSAMAEALDNVLAQEAVNAAAVASAGGAGAGPVPAAGP